MCGPAATILGRGVALAPGDERLLTELSSALEGELRFAEAVKGLNIYGMKVVLPDALAKVVCTKP